MTDKETELFPFPMEPFDLFSQIKVDPSTGQRYYGVRPWAWPYINQVPETAPQWEWPLFNPVPETAPQSGLPYVNPVPETAAPSFQERLLGSLDGIFHTPEFTDRVTLPGVMDHLLSDEAGQELPGLLDSAPEYVSQQLFQLCSQSQEFHGLIADHFEQRGTSYLMKTSGIDPLIVKLTGFEETDPVEHRISLPVLSFSFPADECSLDFSPEIIRGSEASFKLDIPGFAGGAGIRRKITIASNTKALRENMQGHVRADIRLRRFVKDDARLVLVEIADVSSNVYPVGEEHPEYWPLSKPENKVFEERLGVASKKAEKTNSHIIVEQGDWAAFTLALTPEVFSALTSIELPEGLRLELRVRSESKASFKFVLHCPVGKLYDLHGANQNSLRMFVEPAS